MNRNFKALFLALAVGLFCQTAKADQPVYGVNGGSTGVPSNAPFLLTTSSAALSDERVLRSQFGNITLTDGGPNGFFDIGWTGQLGLTNGGTGGNGAQAGTNSLLDGIAGAAAANGDTLARVSGNWTRIAKGTDGFVWTMVSGSPGWAASASGAPAGSSYVTISLDGSLTSERVLTGTSNRVTITDGGAGGNVTLDVGSDVVLLTASQTLTNKTLTSPSIGTSLIFELGANDTTIQATAPAAARLYTIPDAGGAASFVMTEGAQTINGVKTMGSATRFNANIQNSSGNTITLPSSAATLATLALSESLTNKTLPSAILQTQLTLDQTTGDYTITWSNPGATRAYNVYDAGGSADFAMKSGTPTNQAIAYGDGNKIVFLAPGSNGQVVKMSGSTLSWGSDNSSGFGGSGSGGATTKGAVTETTPVSLECTTFTQTVSTTWAPLSGTVVNCTSTADFNGTTNISGQGYYGGAATTNGRNGSGPCGGYRGAGNGGGGGGGNAGTGGDGGAVADSGGNNKPFTLEPGSGGGGGNATAGGNGGGLLKVCAIGAITIGASGTIDASGQAGTANTGAGGKAGGGGAGGTVLLASQTSITQTGTASVAGGNGGNGGASSAGQGGGGGGGGYYVRISPSNTGAGSITTTAGTGGTGNNAAGTAGTSGTAMAITGTPNHPLIGSLEKHLPILAAFARIHAPNPHDLKLSEKQTIGTLAALDAKSTQEYENLCHLYQFGEDFSGNKVVKLDQKQSEKLEALRNAS